MRKFIVIKRYIKDCKSSLKIQFSKSKNSHTSERNVSRYLVIMMSAIYSSWKRKVNIHFWHLVFLHLNYNKVHLLRLCSFLSFFITFPKNKKEAKFIFKEQEKTALKYSWKRCLDIYLKIWVFQWAKAFLKLGTAWKMSVFVFGVFLVRIFPHLEWIRRDIQCKCGKCEPEKLRIRTFFTQWGYSEKFLKSLRNAFGYQKWPAKNLQI